MEIGNITGLLRGFIADERNKTYLVLIAVVFVFGLFLSFFTIPKFAELSRTARTVADLNDKIDMVNGRVKRMDEITKKLKDLKEENDMYLRQLPAQKEISRFLDEISSMARDSNVKILAITPTNTENTPKKKGEKAYYVEMPVKITAKGGYHQLGQFIARIEEGERLIIVEDMGIRYDQQTPWTHDVNLLLITYMSLGGDE